jgi:hypothetical protein
MRTTLTAVAAAATVAVAAIATPSTADARNGWWAPAIIGGLAAGAIIGSAYARPYYGYTRPGPTTAAGAGEMAIAIACAERRSSRRLRT